MRIIDVEQGSPEWLAARLGKVSASRIADMTARTKSGWGASRENYKAELIVERLTGQSSEKYTNAAMQWGTEKEPDACAEYAFMHNAKLSRVGVVLHPSIDMACASPDRLCGDDGLIEVKCPNSATHIETLLSETIPDKYIKQMQWQLACTGRAWCDFVSYDPRLPAEMQLFVKRVTRDQQLIDSLENEVRAFLSEVDATLEALTTKFAQRKAA